MTRSPHSFTVREGIAKIRVWRNFSHRATNGKVSRAWEFEYRDESGNRRRCNRAKREEAEAEARKIVKRMAHGAGAMWTSEETAAFRAVKVNLCGFNITPEAATWEYRRARQVLAAVGVDSIEEAARFYVTHHRGGVADKTLVDVVEELLQVRERDGAGVRHLADLKSRLKRFVADAGCKLAQLTAPTIEAWLAKLTTEKRTRKNYRAALSNLFTFARARGYVPQSFDPMKAVAVPKLAKPNPGVFKPEAMKLLLAHCSDSLLPVLAIGCFAGLRQSEILLLDWSDVHWKEGRIRVPEEGKTGGRLAPLPDNLRAWLEPLSGTGPVVKLSASGVSKAIARTVTKANSALKSQASRWTIAWPHNGPRHSYASYRCAQARDVALVSDEMGHDIGQLKRFYRNQRVTPEEAASWFALVPERASNVLEFDFANDIAGSKVPRNRQQEA